MPVYLRRFYVDRLVEVRGKEVEEQKKRNQRKK
jgi:hypothetical protein